MRIRFTKMQGAGNDFVVLDETRGRLGLSAAQYRFLADRHFGVGADQILSVCPPPAALFPGNEKPNEPHFPGDGIALPRRGFRGYSEIRTPRRMPP